MRGHYLTEEEHLAKKYSVLSYIKDQSFLQKLDHRIKVLKAIHKLKFGEPSVKDKPK